MTVGPPAAGPFFTARADGDQSRILDPLGMDATGASMIRRYLFPGMTGGLQHVRYFSLMTWIVGSFHRSETRISWRVFVRRLEHALRVATLHAQREVKGLVGRRSTPFLDELAGSAKVDLDRRLPSAFEAQYYGASFEALGLVKRVPNEAPRVTSLGRDLLKAMDDEIGGERASVRNAIELLQSGPAEMRVADLREISTFLHLRQVRPSEPEHKLLMRALMGARLAEDPSANARSIRARALALVLAILSEPRVDVSSSVDLRDILWSARVSGPVRQAYDEELAVWRCFGERQEQRVALGAIWYVILEWMRAERPLGISLVALVSRAVKLLPDEPSQGGSSPQPFSAMKWGVYEDQVGREAGATIARRSAYRRALVASVARKGDTAPTTEERIRLALQLIAACTSSWRAEERGGDSFAYGLHDHGGGARMTLPWFADQLESKREEPVAGVLRWLVERCVLDQVQRVGYAKGPGISKVLLIREDNEVRFAREVPRNDPFMQDADRLGAALAMLEGLSLVKRQQERFSITSTGSAVLRLLAPEMVFQAS